MYSIKCAIFMIQKILAIHLTISPTSAPSSSLNEPTRNSLQGQKPVAALVSNPSVENIDLGISSGSFFFVHQVQNVDL